MFHCGTCSFLPLLTDYSSCQLHPSRLPPVPPPPSVPPLVSLGLWPREETPHISFSYSNNTQVGRMPFEQCGSAKAWKKSSRCVVWRAAPTTAPSASHLSKCLHFSCRLRASFLFLVISQRLSRRVSTYRCNYVSAQKDMIGRHDRKKGGPSPTEDV